MHGFDLVGKPSLVETIQSSKRCLERGGLWPVRLASGRCRAGRVGVDGKNFWPQEVPFSNSLLREVQSNFAQQATSLGYATFHEGLLDSSGHGDLRST